VQDWKLLVKDTVRLHQTYPYELRIAAILYRRGVTEEDFSDFLGTNNYHKDPQYITIYNHLRDLWRGLYSSVEVGNIPTVVVQS